MLKLQGSIPVWVDYDPETKRVLKVEVNLASELYNAVDAFDGDGNDVTVDLAAVEQDVQNADWPKPEVVIDHREIVRL